MAVSEAHKRASVKYNKEKTRQINFRFTEHDADILERLDAVPNKQGYIKALIRADIARAKSEAEATSPAQKEEEQTMNKKLYEGYGPDGRRVEIVLDDDHIWIVDAETGDRDQYNDEWYSEDDTASLAAVKASMISEGYRL